ncbi:MAG: TfoX/Sxy family protein [bacterium]|nr:TfoX/Sxy family protein [bacterium]MCP4968009.1 TfoX/Sxy family protein [bacterium]
MPRGSDYPGPSDALERYAAAVEESGEMVKGAKNPYTSRNGHMFSFLAADGTTAIRLSDELADEFLSAYESGPVIQYGSVMRGYVSVPDDLLRSTTEIGSWFKRSYDWIGTLEPKATKKK